MTPSSNGLAQLGLGCWAFGGGYWQDQHRDDSIKTIHAALRSGIRHFDTAQGYGKGTSEQLTGQQLRRFAKTIPRESYSLATKLFLPKTPEELEKAVRISLQRLCTPYIDILYIHWPDSSKPLEPYILELERLRQAGLFRYLGVSNFTEDLLQEAIRITEISYCQFPVSLLWTKSLHTLAPLCRSHRITTVGYSPLGLGLLSGRYRNADQLPKTDLRRRLFPFQDPYRGDFHQLLDTLSSKATELSTTSALLALLWARMQPVDVILTGARTKTQLQGAVTTDSMIPAEGCFSRIEELASQIAAKIPDEEDNPFFHRW